jgi:predicted transcriptional regulator
MPIQITIAQERQLEHLAAEHGCSVDDLAQDAIAHFLAFRSQFVGSVEEGRKAAMRGELLDHEAVVARIDDLLKH